MDGKTKTLMTHLPRFFLALAAAAVLAPSAASAAIGDKDVARVTSHLG